MEARPNSVTAPVHITTTPSAPLSRTASTINSTTKPTNPSLLALRPPTAPRQASQNTKLAQSFVAPEAAEQDGFWDNTDTGGADDADAWGAMDDDEGEGSANNDTFFDTQTPASTSNRSSVAMSRPSTSDVGPAAGDGGGGGEPDFAAWLTAQQGGKKVTKPLPKGLGIKAAVGAQGKAGAGPVVKKAAVLGKGVVKAAPVVKKSEKEVAEEDAWGAWD